jgi:hypothetical protein
MFAITLAFSHLPYKTHIRKVLFSNSVCTDNRSRWYSNRERYYFYFLSEIILWNCWRVLMVFFLR